MLANKIYNMACLKGIKDILNNSIDHVVIVNLMIYVLKVVKIMSINGNNSFNSNNNHNVKLGDLMTEEITDIDIKFSTKHLPFDYKWLEFRLMINKELYDEKVIDFKVFKLMEESLLARMTKIRNEYADKITN